MPSKLKKVLILCSGGDAPGMNATIRAAVRTAIHHDIEIYGCLLGYHGLIEGNIFQLTNQAVGNIIQRGGTILKTARSMPFLQPEVQTKCQQFLLQQGFDGIVVLGGNGSFQGARALDHNQGLQIVGIPCTIDNDIVGTEYCIGFDTACNTAIKAIDNIRDTAFSHDRNFIIEVMGKNSGFLAMEVGLSVGAELILTPERPYTIDEICTHKTNKTRDKSTSIIVSAECDNPGHSFQLAENIYKQCNEEYKVCVLGHIQRGGSPSATDRVTGTLMGSAAITSLINGDSNIMVAVQNNNITTMRLPSASEKTRFVDYEKMQITNSIVSKT